DGCVDKPLATLWRNYCQSNRQDIAMKVTICGGGLRAVTREHGLTEYWAHRVTYCLAHPAYPRVFCWVYRHEGRRLKQELRCHAVLCPKTTKAEAMACELRVRLAAALQEFRREKVVRQNARLSLTSAIYDNASIPRRKLLLSTGGANYRPPLERSKSAPKLGAIEEIIGEEEEQENEDFDMEDEEGSVSLAARVMTGSASVSETTSDIVVDYDSSGSEVASGGGGDRSKCVLEEDDDDDDDKELRGERREPKLYHSESLLYCPEPPLSPLTHQVLGVVSEDVDDEGDDLAGTGGGGDQEKQRGDLGLLTSLTCDLTLAEESLTSDQPESLGSHCESCGSSCGACEATDQLESEQLLEANHNHTHTHTHTKHDLGHILEEREAQGKMSARLEGDNISEESGYSEEKDSLHNVDPPKV
ncbi:hypothetical protein Pcinc_029362, partial [Petrolisthes cinctipes]